MDVEATTAKFPVQTLAENYQINDLPTDFVVSKFSDKLLVIITQFGRVGNLIEIRRDVAQKDDPSTSVYNIKVVLGRDDEEVHVAARFLMNVIPTEKPVTLSLSLKDFQLQTLRQVADRLKTHPCLIKSA